MAVIWQNSQALSIYHSRLCHINGYPWIMHLEIGNWNGVMCLFIEGHRFFKLPAVLYVIEAVSSFKFRPDVACCIYPGL